MGARQLTRSSADLPHNVNYRDRRKVTQATSSRSGPEARQSQEAGKFTGAVREAVETVLEPALGP